jgi:signal transduction histidine kinase
MTGERLVQQGRRLIELVETLRVRSPDDAELRNIAGQLHAELNSLNVAVARHHVHEVVLERSRTELESDRAEWRRLFELAPDPYIVSDRNGLIMEVNRSAAATFVVPVRTHRTLVLRFAAESRADIQRMLRDADAEPVVVRLVDNEAFRGELHCVPIGADRLLWLLRDISEAERGRELLEQAADRERRAADELRSIDAMRRAFLLAASHDLRGPLATVAGLAAVLADSRLPDAQRSPTVERLQRTAAETVAILDNLLDYERIDAGAAQLRLKSVELAPVIEQAARSVPSDGHELTVEVGEIQANVDVALIERIVANLVGNAVQHTPPGCAIWVRFTAQPDGLLLVVEDNGPGIPWDQRHDLFELFERGTGVVGGLGVGLALVRRFAQLHGGYARVEDRVGGGASFQVLLALKPALST